MTVRRQYTFYGEVQGVGFRYRARHAAELYGCSGWVRNELNGSVTMEIQGDTDAIERVLLSIAQGTYIRIEDWSCRDLPPVEGERGFHTVR